MHETQQQAGFHALLTRLEGDYYTTQKSNTQ